jgi:hypothetical protein
MIAQKLLATHSFAESLPKARNLEHKPCVGYTTPPWRLFSEEDMQDASPRALDEQPVGTSENRVDQTDLRPSDLPDPNDLPELRIYSRSAMFFWWPVWVTGYILAAITYFGGETLSLSNGTKILVHPNTGLGISFIVILTLIMMLANVRL